MVHLISTDQPVEFPPTGKMVLVLVQDQHGGGDRTWWCRGHQNTAGRWTLLDTTVRYAEDAGLRVIRWAHLPPEELGDFCGTVRNLVEAEFPEAGKVVLVRVQGSSLWFTAEREVGGTWNSVTPTTNARLHGQVSAWREMPGDS